MKRKSGTTHHTAQSEKPATTVTDSAINKYNMIQNACVFLLAGTCLFIGWSAKADEITNGNDPMRINLSSPPTAFAWAAMGILGMAYIAANEAKDKAWVQKVRGGETSAENKKLR